MSKVPSAGHRSLSAKANGIRPSFCICLAQRDHLVPRRRDRVPLRRERALVVEDHPRVVVDRHEVVVAVKALAQRLGRGVEVAADLVPYVVDGLEEALGREVLHAVPGEPGRQVVGRALQVRRDVVLERVVVDSVNRDLDVGRLLRTRHQGREGLLGRRVGVVRAEADAAAGRRGSSNRSGWNPRCWCRCCCYCTRPVRQGWQPARRSWPAP